MVWRMLTDPSKMFMSLVSRFSAGFTVELIADAHGFSHNVLRMLCGASLDVPWPIYGGSAFHPPNYGGTILFKRLHSLPVVLRCWSLNRCFGVWCFIEFLLKALWLLALALKQFTTMPTTILNPHHLPFGPWFLSKRASRAWGLCGM